MMKVALDFDRLPVVCRTAGDMEDIHCECCRLIDGLKRWRQVWDMASDHCHIAGV